ncbi:MAG: exodeoxyribonuclease gamma subunit, partial [Solirubrobacteraceae bacterium]|nr:exodeoxyribonuclease gamma subunit [Solirubrobacteraceae bacterium]
RHPAPPFLAGPLPADAPALVELDDLVRFAEHPVRAFLRRRLEISLWEDDDEGLDALAVELGPLDRSRVGRRLLEGRIAGASMEDCVAAERARGLLPPGRLGEAVLSALRPEVEAVATRALALAGGVAEAVDVRVTLEDGTVVGGTVGDVHGPLLRVVRFARVRASLRIGLYVRWLALSAAHPDRGFTAALVGRARSARDGEVAVARFGELDAEKARRRLEVVVDLYRRGLREPLPLGCATAAAYAQGGAMAAAREWESGWSFPREDKAPEHVLAFGGVLTFAQLQEFEPRAGEAWGPGEASRFGQLARRMWTPLLALEALE